MKTRRLTTVLTSACLLAIIALSVMPIRSNAADTNNPPSKTEPVMTDELMARVIKFAQKQKPGLLSSKVGAIFNLCDGTAELQAYLLETEHPEGHYFCMPLTPGSKDIVIGHKHDGVIEAYLTDKTYKLRAAAISSLEGAHLITNEKALEKFKAELALLAKEAADLPPTATEDKQPVKK